MNNKEKYQSVYQKCFSLAPEQINEKLTYQSIQSWDSVGHMGMIAAIEETFGIALDTDDIIEFSSYAVGIDILKKYGVDISA